MYLPAVGRVSNRIWSALGTAPVAPLCPQSGDRIKSIRQDWFNSGESYKGLLVCTLKVPSTAFQCLFFSLLLLLNEQLCPTGRVFIFQQWL
ncbi:hypothetical protein C8N47_10387 [Mangrovibacterium marinum]|uniref:Uncharacterized protein n=1 Tax=Mangrovibacterium marinum TaxID=1639118 RepID=A0A2T5C4N0_9BACT|nr:hypothetical protein C8N47_10387 [Mangrovibacterium marinum]